MKYATKTFDFEITSVTKNAKSAECIIEGYANTSSKDRVGDVVIPTAFQKSLPTYLKNPVLLVNHDWADIAGVVKEAKITDKGLYIQARVSDTREDLKMLIREGCLRTFSIGYNEIDADIDESTKTKYVKELELLEISVVSVPANTEAMFTAVDATKTEEAQKNLKDFITMVKSVVGMELGDGLLLNIIDYFNVSKGKEVMTKEELIKALQAKSAAPAEKQAEQGGAVETPVEQKQDEQKPAEEAPAPAKDEAMEMLKALMDKVDMLGQGMALCLEQIKKMEEKQKMEMVEEPKAAEEPKKDEEEKPAEEPKAEEDKPAEEGSEEKPMEEPAEEDDEEEKDKEEEKSANQAAETIEEKAVDELSTEELHAELVALTNEITALEDQENM